MGIIIKNQNGIRTITNVNGTMSIVNGKVIVDGKPYVMGDGLDDGVQPIVTIEITGNVERLDVDACKEIRINGNCKRVHTQMGDINITGDVDGDVHTNMGSIECGNVGGDAHTNMGSIHYRKQ